jgi:hypothetical protein
LNNLDIQKEEFRNVWSAMAPRLTGRLVREVVLHHLEPQAAVGVEGQVLHLERQAVDEVEEGLRVRGGGVSDVNSNPPEDGAVDDIFPLNLAMPPIVEWSLHMISVLLDSIDSNDGPLGVCVRTIDTHKCLPCCTAEGA